MCSSRLVVAIVAIGILGLAAGCDELPGHDDPRLSSDFQENGSCDGSRTSCSYRSLATCNGGCKVEDDCHPITRDRCAAHASADPCDADPACSWSVDVCEPTGIYCSGHYSKTSCDTVSSKGCTWGPSCSGDADSCYEVDTREACTGRPGCRWKAE